MAKKIRLDFSKTEERSGWNTRHIPEGLHKMKVDSFQETEAQDGTAMLVFALVPADSKFKSRRFPYYCKLQQNQLWKLRDLLVAAGQTVPKKAVSIDPSVIVGKYIAAEVEDDTYQGNVRSQVQGTYGLDILDEEGAANSDDDADEEEDEDLEDVEGDEDEEDEDLSALSLAELRKRAKGLGIDTTGLKKAELVEAIEEGVAEEDDEDEEDDDEDDLDEDDLEDEDLDDEDLYEDDDDEEEEPAPKRHTPAKKPAAKAAARKVAPAKAAPARRTVKRR
jgi:AAA ATPase containing von Willebrand factor type A (vWA) domain